MANRALGDVAGGAHRQIASSGRNGHDAREHAVRAQAAVATWVINIIERELAIHNVVAFGVVDRDLTRNS